MKQSIIKSKPFQVTLAAVFWITIWYIAAFAIGSELFLPYPHTTLAAFAELFKQAVFWKSIGNSLVTIVSGCLTGCLCGILFAALSAAFMLGKAIITPMITVLRATPVASFIILIYVIIRKMRIDPSAVSFSIVVIMVIPIVYNNLYIAFTSFDKKLDEVACVYRFSFFKKVRILWMPQIRPYLYAGVSNALGFAWKAGVAAEVICMLDNTIGKNLADSKSDLQMDLLFGWTMTVVLLSLLFEFAFKRLLTRNRKRKGKAT